MVALASSFKGPTVSQSTSGLSNASTYLGAASAFVGVLGGISDMIAQRRKNEAEKKYQEYANKMTMLSNAVSQDAITQNEIMYNFASAEESKLLQTQGFEALGSAEASAAAAGVKGNSVLVTLNKIKGTAANAEFVRSRNFKYAMLGFAADRRNAAMAAAMRQDYSYRSTSTVSSALGFTSKLFSTAADFYKQRES